MKMSQSMCKNSLVEVNWRMSQLLKKVNKAQASMEESRDAVCGGQS